MRFFPALPLAVFLPLLLTPLAAFEIVAHRGASFDAPENTLAAEKLAWQHQADAVETDIHLTKDGQVIVCHDKTTQRTTGRPGLIAEMTFAALRELDAGSWKDPKFAGEKLPTLEEQLALLPSGKKLLIEIKVGPEIVPAFGRCLQRAQPDRQRLTVLSFNYATLQAVRREQADLRTLYLVSYKSTEPTGMESKPDKKPKAKKQPTLDEIIAQAQAAGLTGLSLQSTWPLTATDVAKVKKAGLELHVWTIDDVATARHWAQLGVASITTNRAGWLREQLAR